MEDTAVVVAAVAVELVGNCILLDLKVVHLVESLAEELQPHENLESLVVEFEVLADLESEESKAELVEEGVDHNLSFEAAEVD